jgi:glycosyltransferase involved in cell wall biosynthesis
LHTILHVGKFYPPVSGGMETHLRDLATRQAKVAQVRVIVANRARHLERSIIENVSVTRVGRIATIASMPVCPGLAAAIRGSAADIVHIHAPNPGAAYAFLASGHAGKLVITHHADTIGRQFLRRFSDPFVRRLMQKASRIIVTSARYLDTSPELEPFHQKCRVIPLGIEVRQSTEAEIEAGYALRDRFSSPLILAVGRLVPYKGFDVLIRAMKHLPAQLLLIGRGPEESDLQELARVEQVADRVTFLGRVENLRPCFAAASVFVLPSITRAEAFGIVQLEAMAAGLPVVNTDIDSAVPEICIDGVTGITVPPGDPLALSSAIRTLLESYELRRSLGAAASLRVRTDYDVDHMVERTVSLYCDVLGESFRIPGVS